MAPLPFSSGFRVAGCPPAQLLCATSRRLLHDSPTPPAQSPSLPPCAGPRERYSSLVRQGTLTDGDSPQFAAAATLQSLCPPPLPPSPQIPHRFLKSCPGQLRAPGCRSSRGARHSRRRAAWRVRSLLPCFRFTPHSPPSSRRYMHGSPVNQWPVRINVLQRHVTPCRVGARLRSWTCFTRV
jgi:hypothetical protein